MKELKHILTILNSKHLEQEQVLGDLTSESDSLMNKLALTALKNDYVSDREMALELYGEMYDKHKFEILKSKLKQRALTSLLLYDFTDIEKSPRDAYKYRLQKQLIQASLLLLFGARQVAVKQLLKVKSLSDQYSLNGIKLQSCLLLRSHYWFSGEKKAFKNITDDINFLIRIIAQENRAEELYQLATIDFVASKAKHSGAKKMIASAIKELDAIPDKSKSFVIAIYYYKLKISLLQLEDKHSAVIVESKNAIKLLTKNKKFYNQQLYIYFLTTLCESLSFQRKYDELIYSLTEIRQLVDYTNPNRIVIERIAFLANMGNGRYAEADRILNDVLSLPYFALPLEHHIEEWTLFKDYNQLLKCLQIINEHGLNTSEAKKCIDALLLHKLPVFAKDKTGLNISILVFQVIRLILAKDYRKLIQVDKTLDNYIYRYLTNTKEHIRSITFLKLLRAIIKDDLDKKRLNKKVNSILNSLSTKTINGYIEPVEIIPYEQLGSLLLVVI